mgnify:CR=1 FL=1
MPKENVSADEIQQAVLNRIMSRRLLPGERLPTVRELAEELGSNRNTVNKAYQMLLEIGVVETMPGGRKGYLVREDAPGGDQSGGDFATYFAQQAVDLVWQALAAGMPAQQTLKYLADAVDDVYDVAAVRIAFYECNTHDSEEMGAYISRNLGRDVDNATLDELYADIEGAVERYDLLVTTFHHLSEVNQRLADHTDQVVGIDTRVTPETLLGIAHLPQTSIGLVATLQTTTHMLKHMIHSYFPDCAVYDASIDMPEAVVDAVRRGDHLVVTHTCVDQVVALTGRQPDVVVEFQVDEQSMQFLSRRVQQVISTKAEAFHPSSASSVAVG